MSYMAYHEQKQEQERKPVAVEQLYSVKEIAQKICESYEECKEGECPGFAYCRHEKKGTLVWLQKVLNGD